MRKLPGNRVGETSSWRQNDFRTVSWIAADEIQPEQARTKADERSAVHSGLVSRRCLTASRRTRRHAI